MSAVFVWTFRDIMAAIGVGFWVLVALVLLVLWGCDKIDKIRRRNRQRREGTDWNRPKNRAGGVPDCED